MRFFSGLIIMFLFAGCGKSALLMFDKDENFQRSLQYTQEKQLKNYFETLAIFRATHLNSVYPDKYNEKEYFFIGIYIQDDMKKENAGINNPQYSLMLNGKKYTEYKEIDSNDILYKKMPIVNRWTNYYVVSFEKSQSDEMTLEYTKDTNQSIRFPFKKYDKREE